MIPSLTTFMGCTVSAARRAGATSLQPATETRQERNKTGRAALSPSEEGREGGTRRLPRGMYANHVLGG